MDIGGLAYVALFCINQEWLSIPYDSLAASPSLSRSDSRYFRYMSSLIVQLWFANNFIVFIFFRFPRGCGRKRISWKNHDDFYDQIQANKQG